MNQLEEFSARDLEVRHTRGRACIFLLIAFILAMCVLDVVWIQLNTAPPRMFDDSLYLIESVDLYHTLQQRGLSAFLTESLMHSRAGHPPMMKVLPVPMYLLFNPGANSALYAYTLLIAVFSIYLFLLTKSLVDDDKAALLAVIVTCLFPLTYGMWRNVMAEFGIAVATVAFLYHLLRSSEFRNKTHVFLAGVFFGWGLLWKVSFPIFVVGPIVFVLIRRLRERRRGEAGSLILNAALFILTACVVAGPFYIRSFRPVLDFLALSTDIAQVQNWSLGPVFSIRTLLRYWLSNVNFGVSVYFFALIAGLLAFHTAARKSWATPRARWFLVLWFLPPFLVLSFQVLKEIRHLLPAYPAIGILGGMLLARALEQIKGTRQIGALLLLGLFPVYLFIVSSFDLAFLPRKDVRFGRFIMSIRDLERASLEWIPTYTFPANRTHWPIDETLQILAEQSASVTGRIPRVRVAGSNPYFNSLTLDFRARIQRIAFVFENPFNTSISKSDFVVTLSGPNGKHGPVDNREPYLQKLLLDQRLPFTQLATIPVSGQDAEVRIYKRVTDPSSTPRKIWHDLIGETEAYGHLAFTGSRQKSVTGQTTEILVPDPGSEIRFYYVYVPDSRAALQFAVGATEKAPTGCAWPWNVTVTEMDAESPTRTTGAGTIETASPAQVQRWHREAVSLNEFAGKIVEIGFASSGVTSNSASCDGLGWRDIQMTYGVTSGTQKSERP